MGTVVINLPQHMSAQTYYDAIEADTLTAHEIEGICLEGDDVTPFDEINSDGTCEYVSWIKTVPWSRNFKLNRPVFESYLFYLMPDLEAYQQVARGVRMEWVAEGALTTSLGELTSKLSSTTVGLISGDLTLDGLHETFFTTANEALIAALIKNPAFRHTGDNLLAAIMDGVPASLADGML